MEYETSLRVVQNRSQWRVETVEWRFIRGGIQRQHPPYFNMLHILCVPYHQPGFVHEMFTTNNRNDNGKYTSSLESYFRLVESQTPLGNLQELFPVLV